jgi:hypothetical protein
MSTEPRNLSISEIDSNQVSLPDISELNQHVSYEDSLSRIFCVSASDQASNEVTDGVIKIVDKLKMKRTMTTYLPRKQDR